MVRHFGRFALASALLWGWLAGGVAAGEAGGMKLFKVVNPRDEVVIGVSEADLRRFGPGTDIEALAAAFAAGGQVTAWQYAVRKSAEGELQQAPLRRILLFVGGVVRIEPYATPLPVIPPTE